MTDRDELEQTEYDIAVSAVAAMIEVHGNPRVIVEWFIARGWQRIQGEGSRPCRADNTACSEQSGNAPSPTLRQSVAELREIAKDGDFPTLEELDEIRHGIDAELK